MINTASMTIRRYLSYPILATFLASPLLHCGAAQDLAGKNLPGPAGDLAAAGKCPDLNASALAALDFANEFKISAEGAAKLKAGVLASVELKEYSAKIDADLKGACGAIAGDLGAGGDFKSGEDACRAAVKVIGEVKAKLGANLRIALAVKPPVCRVDMNVMADCAAKCDAKVTPGSAKVTCEGGQLSGKCDANCEGSCDVSGGASCNGDCSGSCDATMKGTCSGTCNGKCDGKDSKGACAGTCEGKCEGGTVQGSCTGKCGGSCKMKAAAKCEGTCTGKCSAEFKEPKCAGEVKPPEMSAECKGHCDAQVNAKADCTPATVGVSVVGGADAALQAKLKGTLEKNLPLVFKVAIGMADSAPKVAASGKVAIDGIQGSVQEIASSAGDKAALVGGRITGCFGATFKGALDAAASVKANVSVSVDVKASASASGSASGAAGKK